MHMSIFDPDFTEDLNITMSNIKQEIEQLKKENSSLANFKKRYEDYLFDSRVANPTITPDDISKNRSQRMNDIVKLLGRKADKKQAEDPLYDISIFFYEFDWLYNKIKQHKWLFQIIRFLDKLQGTN